MERWTDGGNYNISFAFFKKKRGDKYSALLHALDPWAGSKGDLGQNYFFSEEGYVAYQITIKEV